MAETKVAVVSSAQQEDTITVKSDAVLAQAEDKMPVQQKQNGGRAGIWGSIKNAFVRAKNFVTNIFSR